MPARVLDLGTHQASGRRLIHLQLDDPSEWPAKSSLPEGHFGLFLAWDATEASNKSLEEIAVKVADQGLAYLVAWGSGSERVHDAFDGTLVRVSGRDGPVLTTWHEDESLEEALTFFLEAAVPADELQADCRSWVTVSVRSEQRSRDIAAIVARYAE